MPEEILNNGAAAEAGAESAENAASDQEVVAPEGGADNQPAAEPEGSPVHTETKPAQNRDENHYYKGLRTKLDRQSESVMDLARAKGLNPKDANEAIQMLKAEHEGKSWPDYQAEQKQTEDLIKSSPLYQDAIRKAEAYDRQQAMAADLAAIQQLDPNIKSLDDLGEEWNGMVSRGMSGVDAFYAMRGKASLEQAAVPPDVGEVGGKGDDENRDFTSEELDCLGWDDLDDENVFQRALRSLGNLKK